jgi:hypothetical protein
VRVNRLLADCTLGAALLWLGTGCSQFASMDATPVPGAAATAARADRTAIPTPVRSPTARPAASPGPAASALPSPSPAGVVAGAGVTDEQMDLVRRALTGLLASPDLEGLEGLLLDRVSLATAEGGTVLDRSAVAAWIRERRGDDIRLVSVERSALAVALQVETEGWQTSAATPTGRITFALHRFAPNGQQDEDRGDWKIDVISAE